MHTQQQGRSSEGIDGVFHGLYSFVSQLEEDISFSNPRVSARRGSIRYPGNLNVQ